MRRAKWTIMQWNPDLCRFVPKVQGEKLAPLSARQRIPAINKIEHKPVDSRAVLFNKVLEKSALDAQVLLNSWTPTLDVNTLFQYATVLARKSGSIDGIPALSRKKLEKYGLLDTLLKKALSSGFPVNLGMASSSGGRPLTPLQYLAKNSNANGSDLQNTIDSSVCLSPELQALKERWAQDLLGGFSKYTNTEFTIIDEYLSQNSQCSLVATELALLTARSLISPFPKSLASLCRKLGSRVEDALLASIANTHPDGVPGIYRRSEYLYSLVGRVPWTTKQRIFLGAYWIHLALKCCRFMQVYNAKELSRPAFWRTWYMSGPTKRGVFIVNPFLLKELGLFSIKSRNASSIYHPSANEKIDDDHIYGSDMFITHEQIPPLTEPAPWTATYTNNDHVSLRDLSLVTSASVEGQATVSEAIRNEAMLPQLQGLNRLQSQSWRINQRVLPYIKAFECAADIEEQEHEHQQQHVDPNKEAHKRKIMRRQKAQAIAIAQALGDREFFLPFYMDFRGRCYPATHSILNFMGNESMRSLFLFGEKKPLGPDGLKWLEIHLANLYGQCKSWKFEGKRQWVASNKSNIVAAALDPLKCSWWRRSDKPFQTLAACIELNDAWSSKDPSKYCSALPIQLDGTSNGLQHLVALARDNNNAPIVNLKSGETCADVYTTVGKLISQTSDRKIMKKAIMTFFYGASVANIAKSLSTQEPDSEVPVQWATKLTTIFGPENAIQRWLIDCARRIMHARRADYSTPGSALVWTTPLGLPVVQPYVEPKLMAIRTPLQSFFIHSPFHLSPVIRRKQISGVVANFVHSLDATHMLATARKLPKECSFAAVHDSFWTHASTVPILNKVLRNEFVRLHQNDILKDLREEWMLRYEKFLVLAHVHCDSPLYDQIIWLRDGVSDGYKQQQALEAELRSIYTTNKWPINPPKSEIKWMDNVPHIGTANLPSVKMWVPLYLDPPPPQGTFDITKVNDAQYFFS